MDWSWCFPPKREPDALYEPNVLAGVADGVIRADPDLRPWSEALERDLPAYLITPNASQLRLSVRTLPSYKNSGISATLLCDAITLFLGAPHPVAGEEDMADNTMTVTVEIKEPSN